MKQDGLLHPDLADSARVLIARGRLLAEREPDLYRVAASAWGRADLAAFFSTELGWTFEVIDSADMARLHKRRDDVPNARGPRLRREGRETAQAPRLVLMLAVLVCEQLWRRPRMTLNDLLQSVAQVCASDSEQGLLPHFAVVAGEGVSKREAHENRQSMVDALRLIQADGTVTVDADLDRAAGDDGIDLVVTASRDRLAAKFSSLSPSLLQLSALPPHRHLAALTSDSLTDEGEPDDDPRADEPAPSPDSRAARAETSRRRHRAMRRLVDDPGTDPARDEYLQTSTGRNRALNVLHALGLYGTVRRDWWQVSDPTGLGTASDFPHGRRSERQAALALLHHLGRRELDQDGTERLLPLDEVVAVFEQIRVGLPRWAAAYDRRLLSLARAAAAELLEAGFLTDVGPGESFGELRLRPTPAVRMWRVKVSTNAKRADTAADDASDTSPTLFETPGGDA